MPGKMSWKISVWKLTENVAEISRNQLDVRGENIPPTIKLKSKMEFTYRSYREISAINLT